LKNLSKSTIFIARFSSRFAMGNREDRFANQDAARPPRRNKLCAYQSKIVLTAGDFFATRKP
jgi:hypothetical protein